MASACVNNIGMSPENFMDCSTAKFSSYGWLSPRVSFSREFEEEEVVKASAVKHSPHNHLFTDNVDSGKPEETDPAIHTADFEFRLEDPAIMLPADELFSDGKLVPLQLSTFRHSMESVSVPASSGVGSLDTPKFSRSSAEPYLFSPKAPRCSSRWKELLGLKKLYQNNNSKRHELKSTSSSVSSQSHHKNTSSSLMQFLHRGSKSSLNASIDSSLSLPLLKDSENESVSISARLSLSSSSSGHEHDDLPRLSLDSDKPSTVGRNNRSRVRAAKHKSALSSEKQTCPIRGVSVDSPRINSSGKIVFHGLERSSSSPSTFNGGPRYKHGGMERSYSTNVRVTPVLNVPVCSIRGSSKSGVFGLPLFSSQPKKENGGSCCANRSQHCKNRVDRT